MESLAFWSGWLATAAIVFAALVPIVHRLRFGKRAAPQSSTTRKHVILGISTAALAFGHTMTVLPALGSPAATGGGMTALLPAGVAFFILLAHAGIGLQLRDERLKDRVRKRRMHLTTAFLVTVAVATHIIALERAGR